MIAPTKRNTPLKKNIDMRLGFHSDVISEKVVIEKYNYLNNRPTEKFHKLCKKLFQELVLQGWNPSINILIEEK